MQPPGNGCLTARFALGAYLKIKRLERSKESKLATSAMSSSVFSGKIARFVAV